MKKKLVPLFIMLLFFALPVHAEECQHDWEYSITVEPTCIKDGFCFRTCKICNKWEEVGLPAKGHEWDNWYIIADPDCTDPGEKVRYCNVCYERQCVPIPPHGHVMGNWKITKKPTKYQTGIQKRYCSACDYEESKTIPKLKINTKEKNIIKTINNFYSAAKNYNVQKIRSCFIKGSDFKAFVEMKEMAKFCKKHNKKIKYEIKSISIKGSKATVKVRCTYPDADLAIYDAMEDNMYYFFYHPNASDRTFLKAVYKDILYYSKYIYGIPLENVTVTFPMQKKGNSWKIQKTNLKMIDSVHCGYESAYRSVFY